MKREVLLTVMLALVYTVSFNQEANAQPVSRVGDLTFGAGLSRGNSVGHLENIEYGINLHVYYGILEDVNAGVDYTYYLIGENDLGASEINVNGHYFFRNRENLIIYGLGGLNFSSVQADSDVWGNVSSNNIGINAGVGLEYDFGNFAIYGEPKYTLGGWNQLMVTVGARLRL